MWHTGAEVSKAFRDVLTKYEMKGLDEIWKLSGEEMVKTWFCTYLWQYLQAGWCCCQTEFGATSVKCCEKCVPMPLLPPSLGCSCTLPRSTWLAPLEMSLSCAGEDITCPEMCCQFLSLSMWPIHLRVHVETCPCRPATQYWKEVAEYPSAMKGSGKAWQTQWKFLSFFLKRARVILIV